MTRAAPASDPAPRRPSRPGPSLFRPASPLRQETSHAHRQASTPASAPSRLPIPDREISPYTFSRVIDREMIARIREVEAAAAEREHADEYREEAEERFQEAAGRFQDLHHKANAFDEGFEPVFEGKIWHFDTDTDGSLICYFNYAVVLTDDGESGEPGKVTIGDKKKLLAAFRALGIPVGLALRKLENEALDEASAEPTAKAPARCCDGQCRFSLGRLLGMK